MKNKISDLENEAKEFKHDKERMDREISDLKTENIKLKSDVKLIRNDHNDLTHQMY